MKVGFLILGYLFCLAPGLLAAPKGNILAHFDHDFHYKKVLQPNGIPCQHCHTFEVDASGKKAKPLPDFTKSAFVKPFKDICHDCHQSQKAQNIEAPQSCFLCHQDFENFQAIKPQNHMNNTWNQSHATNARTDGATCMKCHASSQCAQCHLRRNDIEFKNHSRNFRFWHSIQARAQPHTCESCHARSYCVDCHQGRR